MFRRITGRAVLTGLILLAVTSCRSEVARADDEAAFRAAKAQGRALKSKGDYPGASKAYERALELASRVFGPEDLNTASAQNSLAEIYREMGQYAKAEPLYQRSLKTRESQLGPDHREVAQVLNNLANLYQHVGQYAQAEPLYQRSLKIHETTLGPDHQDVAQILNNQAALYWKLGLYPRAVLLYQRSLKIRESKLGPDHPLVASSLNNLAVLFKAMGQYAQAESLYQRSLKTRESKLGPDHPDVASSLNNLAALYEEMGQYAKAEPLYQRSLTIRESRLGPDHPDVAESVHNLALLYKHMKLYARAEQLYQRSLTICESKVGAEHPDVAQILSNQATLYWEMGQHAQAEGLYQRSLKIRESKLGPDHPDVAQSLNNLAALYKDMGQHAKAEPLYQRSLEIWKSKLGPDHPYVATSLSHLASLHAETEKWSEATTETERWRRIVRRHMARTLPALSEREQLAFLQITDGRYFPNALSLGLHRRTDPEMVTRCTGWILNGKGVAQEVLAQQNILAVERSDPALADLVQQLLTVRRHLASLGMTVPKTGQEADRRKRIQTLSQQEQELSRQLGQATGRNIADDPWVEPDSVRKCLAKDTVLIEVARFAVRDFRERRWSPARYVAWVIPADGLGQISIVDLGEARQVDAAVQAMREVLNQSESAIRSEGEAKAEKQLGNVMRDLTKLVLEPLESRFGQASRLIISPDAALWLIPWGALPLADGRYCVEKYQIRYCISGRELVRQSTNSGRKTSDPILFANPDYDLGPGEADAATRAILRDATPVDQGASNLALGSHSSLPRVSRLPGTAEEAAAIKPNVARYAGTDVVLYEDQNALEGVFKVIHSPRVLVLSTHGFFMPDQEVASNVAVAEARSDNPAVLTTEGKPLENPLLRCGLLLAGCNRQADGGAGLEDGILTGLEIVGTDLRDSDLVVLSACETGLGQVRNGEGVAGLRQAFQLAGAKAVVSTLWQIPDQETVELMNAFFANLSSGQSKADALRNAQLAQIKARRESKSAAHPYYWAAFTLTGQ